MDLLLPVPCCEEQHIHVSKRGYLSHLQVGSLDSQDAINQGHGLLEVSYLTFSFNAAMCIHCMVLAAQGNKKCSQVGT